MPRDRSRGRVARPDDTAPAEDGSDEAEDDDDPTPDLSERDGTIDDLLDDQVGNVEQQVLSGSQANLRIAPEVNPGFVDTEVVNRMGLVLSLNLEFDPSRQQWVPAVVDKTERQALEQTLAEDRATDDLSGGTVDTDDSTVVDSNDDLKLDDGGGTDNYNPSQNGTGFASGPAGIAIRPGADTDAVRFHAVLGTENVAGWTLTRDSDDKKLAEISGGGGDHRFTESLTAGTTYLIQDKNQSGQGDAPIFGPNSYPVSCPGGDVVGGAGNDGYGSGDVFWIDDVSMNPAAREGTATSSFDNPCTATSTRSAQYDVCSKTSDVTVDLYNGDPAASDSTLLARNIDPREDISDLPDAFTDLQYKITLTRDEGGETPKVSRLGHQLIR